MHLTLAAVGRARDGPVRRQIDDYIKRLPWAVSLIEVAEADGPDRKAREADKLLAAVPDGAALIVLDERGRGLTSREVAGWIGHRRDEGMRHLAVLIGGADGLDDSVRQRADLVLALGKLTWPHMLVRVMILEQLYRARTILIGHPYHRD